jgi:hypothetical protein
MPPYDERTSTMLADTSALQLERYRGDLAASGTTQTVIGATERRLLREFKASAMSVSTTLREAKRA